MTQSQLNREIARATGESVDFVRNFGFREVCMPMVIHRPKKVRRMIVAGRRGRRGHQQQDMPAVKAA